MWIFRLLKLKLSSVRVNFIPVAVRRIHPGRNGKRHTPPVMKLCEVNIQIKLTLAKLDHT